MATITLPYAINLNLPGGRIVALKKGDNPIPDALLDHWYVRAHLGTAGGHAPINASPVAGEGPGAAEEPPDDLTPPDEPEAAPAPSQALGVVDPAISAGRPPRRKRRG
jgi:hypothetical protein